MVADPVGFDGGINVGALSVSATGLVAYRSGGANRHQLVWFDRSGKALSAVGAPDENGLSSPRLSPVDDRRVAVFRTVQGNADIWLLDALHAQRFTSDAGLDRYPIWSPDGNTIVFDSNRNGHRDLYQKPSSGAGSEALLLESPLDKSAQDWSADGRFLLYNVQNDPTTGYDLWVLPLRGDRKPFVFLKTNFDERRARFSPNGRWVAYMSNDSGRYDVYVRPFPGTDEAPGAAIAPGTTRGQWLVSTAGGQDPSWSPDGKELYYIAPDAKLMAVPIAVQGPTLEVGAPKALFQTRIYGGGNAVNVGRQYDGARDGRFLINVVSDEATDSPITLILNWAAASKK
jgi:Tol biopolymer transport system component